MAQATQRFITECNKDPVTDRAKLKQFKLAAGVEQGGRMRRA